MSESGIPEKIAVIETDGVVSTLLKNTRGVTVSEFDMDDQDIDCIIVGTHKFGDNDYDVYRAVMEHAASGVKLIVLDHADKWGEILNSVSRSLPEIYQSGGIIRYGNRGRHFVGNSTYLEGLPQAQGMSWEYQTFYRTRNVTGLRLHRWNTDMIVALGGQHTKEILSSLSRIPLGKGHVFLSSLDIIPGLASEKPQSAVAKKLFLNLLEKSIE